MNSSTSASHAPVQKCSEGLAPAPAVVSQHHPLHCEVEARLDTPVPLQREETSRVSVTVPQKRPLQPSVEVAAEAPVGGAGSSSGRIAEDLDSSASICGSGGIDSRADSAADIGAGRSTVERPCSGADRLASAVLLSEPSAASAPGDVPFAEPAPLQGQNGCLG